MIFEDLYSNLQAKQKKIIPFSLGGDMKISLQYIQHKNFTRFLQIYVKTLLTLLSLMVEALFENSRKL